MAYHPHVHFVVPCGGGGMTAQTSTAPWNLNNKYKYKDVTIADALADLQATMFSRPSMLAMILKRMLCGGASGIVD